MENQPSRPRARPLPTAIILAGSAAVVAINALYLFGAFTAAAGLPYGKAIPLSQAWAEATATPISKMLADSGGPPLLYFVPTSAVVWAAYILARRRQYRPIFFIALTIISLIPAMLFSPLIILLAPILAIIATPLVLTGAADGELYSEAFVCFAAVGWWILLASLFACIELLIRRTPSWICPQCSYDLRGLTGTTCPECGEASGGRHACGSA